MKNRNRIIVGSALGLAAIAVAIDHTRHRLPEPEPVSISQEQAGMNNGTDESDESPCGLDAGSSPCSMSDTGSDADYDSDSSPCGLGD